MTHSNNYKPFMMYLTPTDADRLKRFAKRMRVPMTQIVREAINSRIAPGDPYVTGFNNGLDKAVETIEAWQPAKMRFPSGASFAEVLQDEIIQQRLVEVKNDEGGIES